MNEDIPKIGCVGHDCDACANQAERVAALEAKALALQALSDEYAERVTKEIEATKLLRAALVGLFGSGVLDEHGGEVMGADCHICDAVNAATKALEATK